MSFSKKSDSATLHNAIKRAYNAGILMVASTGNEGSSDEDNVEYPAAYKEVVAVGAVTPEGKLSDMTSTGKELELLAPGEYIKTTGWLDIENVSSGTSFATPHVTGVASLLWQKDLTKSADFIRKLLVASAKTITEEDGKEYSLVDYEYACKIYDEYNEQYTENDDVEELTEEFENESEAEDYSDEVEGRWKSVNNEANPYNHQMLANNAAKYATGTNTSVEAKIVKLGAAYCDKESSGLSGFNNYPEWHGNYTCNYLACYNYATLLALAGGDGSKAISNYPRYNDNYNTMKSQVTTTGIVGRKWRDILSDFEYNNKNDSTKKKYRKWFIFGMAMHIATDVFAHSAIVNGQILKHTVVNNCDDYNVVRERYYSAYELAKEVYADINTNCEGNLYDFFWQSKYYNGSFQLCNVAWYSDGMNIYEYDSYINNNMRKVATMNYIDYFIPNY